MKIFLFFPIQGTRHAGRTHPPPLILPQPAWNMTGVALELPLPTVQLGAVAMTGTGEGNGREAGYFQQHEGERKEY